eukprot:CAMPEP_0197591456 /NCGR_PEP_ID=MMETSP1326-20131121/13322_1 /TAXON_ID=1155430 /ORGANISM="Genus nov. species nov., Strain RCC2288" /LENGTH=32 /DNA_ID= /DNA_START= /DNA_END= /DNA_ORIENTATION=
MTAPAADTEQEKADATVEKQEEEEAEFVPTLW